MYDDLKVNKIFVEFISLEKQENANLDNTELLLFLIKIFMKFTTEKFGQIEILKVTWPSG